MMRHRPIRLKRSSSHSQVDLRVVGEAAGREAIDLVRNVELDIW
jgi:hypothetical protein